MKYIREKNGKREIVEKRKHSNAYVLQAVVKWIFCISILALTLLLCGLLDKKLNDGKLMAKITNPKQEKQVEPDTQKEEPIELETETEEQDGLSVCIDPGHGGMDPGCDFNGRVESEDNWKLSLEIKKELESAGIKVIMTRQDNDTKVFLKDRVEIANASDADYFVSVHRNKGDGYGVETWKTGSGGGVTDTLTENVHKAIVDTGVQRDRGIKTGTETGEGSDYYVIGNTKMPACLIEFGFINSEEDNRLFDEKMSAYAKAIVKAVQDTYAQFGESEDLPQEDLEGETDTAQGAGKQGIRLSYPAVDNISALSGETLDWGQGTNVDELNRPTGSLSYQEKFKDYTADFIIPTTDKKIYLTLDEGYEYGCTPSILSTLKEKGVKAVFFVTQPYINSSPELVKQIIDDGHILGNHSLTHPAAGLPSQSVEEQQKEVMDVHNFVKENYNYDMFLFRFPAGKFSEQSLAVLNNCGYRSVFWSFAYLDYDVENQPDETESLNKMLERLHPGAIYLLHAESWTNTNVLGQFIDKVREAGYEFADYSETVQ